MHKTTLDKAVFFMLQTNYGGGVYNMPVRTSSLSQTKKNGLERAKTMNIIKAKDLINIYISLFNYRNTLIDQKLNEDAQEIQNTIEYILNMELTELKPLPLGRIQ